MLKLFTLEIATSQGQVDSREPRREAVPWTYLLKT